MKRKPAPIDQSRRNLLKGSLAVGGMFAFHSMMPAWASPKGLAHAPATKNGATLSGEDIALSIANSSFSIGNRTGHAVTVNGSLPAPLIRLREGQNVRLAVTNHLEEDTSIHWHGLLLPFQMDGVPGVSFPGIKPHETFVYEFPIIQSGTYWYHSHSGLQEAMGHYGPIVVDPAGTDPIQYDREHIIVLSDWSFMHPHEIMRTLKQSPDYFNRQQQTLAGLLAGEGQDIEERIRWAGMRMMPSDIADVTGATYTYLINGHGPNENWTGLFEPGERVRLRIINASAMSIFNVRIPGLSMTVVNADGENVQPVETDEFQIGVAETYDVVVTPREDRAYSFVAESIDRSGLGRATLAPRLGMEAPVPALRERPTLTMRDMGMGGMASMGDGEDHSGMDHGSMDHGDMSMRDPENAPGIDVNPGVDMIAPNPADRTGDRGLGLENVPHRVLTYTQLRSLNPNPDPRSPSRELVIHLTGNMERYMWSLDGRRFAEIVEPIRFARDERVRVKLVNNTMMTHPIHLHGHFFEIVNGQDGHQPRKHTVNVLPGGYVKFDLTADAPGDWAFHCHLLMHMHAGMFNVVKVRPMEGEPT
ncbi:MAG: copper resistance system multicopper oxidase [Altererythrobacter sp. XM-24bin4]|uniref:copper resistance system multicopper oxidase n=1 Tax=uncultured Altererythrobacter sp. TaxID=500840 RepID=UPI000D7A7ED2|nr:copper resistance system multicopper oxidase [uncultured Altererythrobacter sp.]PWL26494.1 MAG: copper resistance system multicopper oxidase [Altererythrobacter sp. XM-24bin4]